MINMGRSRQRKNVLFAFQHEDGDPPPSEQASQCRANRAETDNKDVYRVFAVEHSLLASSRMRSLRPNACRSNRCL